MTKLWDKAMDYYLTNHETFLLVVSDWMMFHAL